MVIIPTLLLQNLIKNYFSPKFTGRTMVIYLCLSMFHSKMETTNIDKIWTQRFNKIWISAIVQLKN